MSKIIPYSTLVRQQHLNFLKHKGREYREREDYLLRLRRLLFQIEGQLRQAEIQQLDVFQQIARHFKIPLNFPDMGDRLGLQQFFATHPFLVALQAFFTSRLTAEECLQKFIALQAELSGSPQE